MVLPMSGLVYLRVYVVYVFLATCGKGGLATFGKGVQDLTVVHRIQPVWVTISLSVFQMSLTMYGFVCF